MATKSDLHEGQELTVTHTRRTADPSVGRVVRVGRTLVDIETIPGSVYSTVKFKIETQHETGDFSSYRFWLPGEYEEKIVRDGLYRELRDIGVRLDYIGTRKLTSDQLRRILDIVRETP